MCDFTLQLRRLQSILGHDGRNSPSGDVFNRLHCNVRSHHWCVGSLRGLRHSVECVRDGERLDVGDVDPWWRRNLKNCLLRWLSGLGGRTVGRAIVNQRALSGALLSVVARVIPEGVLVPLLAVLHGVSVLTAALAEN